MKKEHKNVKSEKHSEEVGKVGQLTENDPIEVKYRVGLWEPSGGEHYERLKPLSYPHTDIFPICFDVSNEQTFKDVKSLWKPEMTYYMPLTPWLLVGTKSDLRMEADAVKDSAAISSDLQKMNSS